MPFVRISLAGEITRNDRRKISEEVHLALMDAFTVPEDDYFQVIEAVDSESLFYPRQYLGIDHTSNIVFVQITAGSGRIKEQKEKLYSRIAHRIEETTSVKSSDVIIILVENGTKENWSFGNGKIQELSHISPAKE